MSKKKLLIDIIKKAPVNSIFEIDYWNEELLDYISDLNDTSYTIDIDLIGRQKLIIIVDKYPIEELITHFDIVSDGNVLLRSFDSMEVVTFSSKFNCLNPLDYPEIEIGISDTFNL